MNEQASTHLPETGLVKKKRPERETETKGNDVRQYESSKGGRALTAARQHSNTQSGTAAASYD